MIYNRIFSWPFLPTYTVKTPRFIYLTSNLIVLFIYREYKLFYSLPWTPISFFLPLYPRFLHFLELKLQLQFYFRTVYTSAAVYQVVSFLAAPTYRLSSPPVSSSTLRCIHIMRRTGALSPRRSYTLLGPACSAGVDCLFVCLFFTVYTFERQSIMLYLRWLHKLPDSFTHQYHLLHHDTYNAPHRRIIATVLLHKSRTACAQRALRVGVATS